MPVVREGFGLSKGHPGEPGSVTARVHALLPPGPEPPAPPQPPLRVCRLLCSFRLLSGLLVLPLPIFPEVAAVRLFISGGNHPCCVPARSRWRPKASLSCGGLCGLGAPVFLPGESQGQGSLVGFPLWGRTESDTTEETQT